MSGDLPRGQPLFPCVFLITIYIGLDYMDASVAMLLSASRATDNNT